MDNKISNTFCVMPWMHLHAWPDGKAMLCCVANGGDNMGEVGDFSKNTFEEIINSEKLKEIRLDLLKGKRVVQCSSCYNQEDLNVGSFREHLNKQFSDNISTFIESTDQSGFIENPKMLYMDFRFSNLCNLGCRTCGHQLSSTLANSMDEDTKKIMLHDILEKNVLSKQGTITSFTNAREDFFEKDVLPYIDDCKMFYFAGGEPLMHQEHYNILKYLDENKLYDKDITYSTNMTLLKWKKIDFLETWKNFNNIKFFCSIDGEGKVLEYIRDRSKHDVVFSNLQKLINLKNENFHKNFRVEICFTLSPYNVYYLSDFFEFLDNNGFLDANGLSSIVINFAYGDGFQLCNLPKFAKTELKEKIKLDSSNKSVIKALLKFPQTKASWDIIEEKIDSDATVEFDIFIKDFLFNLEKAKIAVPWIASVVERYKIV